MSAPRLAVALSGGGHRACLWALGVLLYLADAGRNPAVASVASVSGGSLANAAVGHALDFNTADREEIEGAVARAARRCAHGSVLAWWPTWVYLGVTALVVPAALVLVPWRLGLPGWLEGVFFAAGLLAWSWLLALRGAVCGRAFAATMFDGTPGLADLRGGLDHVICATDLHAGEHVYFSRSFVAAYRFGLGTPGRLPLHRAVQASAAFPPVFGVAWIRTGPLGFRGGRPEAQRARRMALTDGGVYDNMADQWARGLAERKRRWADLEPHFEEADELVVANGSAGLAWGATWTLRIPFLGGLLALLRDKSVLYDNGTAVRRSALVDSFDLAARTGSGLPGCLVHIEQSPFRAPDAFAGADEAWPERARRARDALAALGDEPAARAAWKAVADENEAVATTLVGLGEDVSARLLHHAYVLAMVNMHVILGYPLLAIPERARFAALVRG